MNNKILLSLFLFLILLISSFPIGQSALGSQLDYVEDFEDDTLTQQADDDYYGVEWFNTYNQTDNNNGAYVDNNRALSGTKSYRINRNNYVFLNFTYSDTQIISNLTFAFNFDSLTVGTEYHWYGYDKNDVQWLEFRIDQLDFLWRDFNGWSRIGADNEWSGDEDTWWNFTMVVVTNDTINVNTGQSSDTVAPYVVIDNPRLAYFNFTTPDLDNTERMWFDDIEIDVGAVEGGIPTETIPPCDPYSTIGTLDTGVSSQGIPYYRYLWNVYAISDIMYVHRVDLEIDITMVENYGVNETHLRMKINEYPIGGGYYTCTELVQLGDGENYRATWSGLNVFVNNTPCVTSFYCTLNFGSGSGYYERQHWILPIIYDDDINNDGYSGCVAHYKDGWWNNHGNYIYERPSGDKTYFFRNGEFVVRMCVDRLGTSEFNDDLNNYVESSHSTAKIYCDQINFDWFLKSEAMAYVNELWIDTPSKTYVAVNITTQTGHIYFTPIETGTHYVNLSSNDVNVSTDSFTVSGTCDNWVYTTRNPSTGEAFKIFYNYSGTSNGAVRIYDKNMNLKGNLFIEPTSSSSEYGALSFQLTGHGVYNIHLCSVSNVGGQTIYNPLYSYVHVVQGTVVNYIDVSLDDYVGYTETPFFITGEHAHLGKNIHVYVGKSEVKSVSYSERFNLKYTPLKEGVYNANLILIMQSGKRITLDSQEFSIKSNRYLEPEPLLPKLNPAIAYTVGSILMIPFILMPMIICGILNYPKDKIPDLAYYLTGSVGIVLNVGLGLYDFWALFFILAVGVIIIIAMYIMNKRR